MKGLYNSDEESIYLQYVDTNNLYGQAMIQKLPTHRFLWKKAEGFNPEKRDELVKKYLSKTDQLNTVFLKSLDQVSIFNKF